MQIKDDLSAHWEHKSSYLTSEGPQPSVNAISIPLAVMQLSYTGIRQQALGPAVAGVPRGAGATGIAARCVGALTQWMAWLGGRRTLIDITAVLRWCRYTGGEGGGGGELFS